MEKPKFKVGDRVKLLHDSTLFVNCRKNMRFWVVGVRENHFVNGEWVYDCCKERNGVLCRDDFPFDGEEIALDETK